MNKVLIMKINKDESPYVLKDEYYANFEDFLSKRALPKHEENFELRVVDFETFNIETSHDKFLCDFNLLAYDINPVETNGKDVDKWFDRVKTFEYFWDRAVKVF